MKEVIPLSLQQWIGDGFLLMLQEPESGTRLPILIGAGEAQSILSAQGTLAPKRPMTHMLMAEMLERHRIDVAMTTIDRVEEGIFYATVHTVSQMRSLDFDSRASDAIALAILSKCPIFADEKVIAEAGIAPDENHAEPTEELTTEELEQRLSQCIENEDYEQAAKLQEIIDRKKI